MGGAGSCAQDEASNNNSADDGPQYFILEMGETSLVGRDCSLRIEAIVPLKESERVLVSAPRRDVIESWVGSFPD